MPQKHCNGYYNMDFLCYMCNNLPQFHLNMFSNTYNTRVITRTQHIFLKIAKLTSTWMIEFVGYEEHKIGTTIYKMTANSHFTTSNSFTMFNNDMQT